ncbi:response regulator transcription factor [Actinosynnema sp. CS-041913]|uniref:helix-turn-helix transcriptional regulator n=1 Tax=Actinosynnema sp. CS-041913 TaxID=3239917 RepID=UPI003D8C63F2
MTVRDLRRALDLVRLFNEDDGDDELARSGLAGLGRLVGCELAGVVGSDHVARRLTAVDITLPDRNMVGRPGFAEAVGQHPGFSAYRAGRLPVWTAVALTDLVDMASLRRLPLYVDFYRPERTVDQLLCVLELKGRQSSVLVFNRSRPGFSRRDREIVELLAPHLSQAMARRERYAALSATARHVSVLGEQRERALARLPELTSRERQVAVHVAGGATDREIARNLGISTRTVHNHLGHIYRKLGLTNRAGLSALIHRGS